MPSRPIAVALIAATALVLAGCGLSTGGQPTATATATATAQPTAAKAPPTTASGTAVGTLTSQIDATSQSNGVAGVPAAALPGITVLGTGEQTAKPDRVLVRLTISSITPQIFTTSGAPSPSSSQANVESIMAALKAAGAHDIVVDPFGASALSPLGGQATEVEFESDSPQGVGNLIAAARRGLQGKKKAVFPFQTESIVFGLSNCAEVEQKAWSTALADAHTRAEALARLAGVHLGAVLAVSEATFTPSVFTPGTTGCQSLIPQSGNILGNQTVENTPQAVQIGVTLQVTYALAGK